MDQLIITIATTDPDPEVRGSAWAMLSQIPTEASVDALAGVLRTAPDDSWKDQALQSHAGID